MGFLGLQREGGLNGLPDDVATAFFDNYSDANNNVFTGSLYRFGSEIGKVQDHIKAFIPSDDSAMSSDTLKKLENLFDKTLPSTLLNNPNGTN
jgi:hypothetical protein